MIRPDDDTSSTDWTEYSEERGFLIIRKTKTAERVYKKTLTFSVTYFLFFLA